MYFVVVQKDKRIAAKGRNLIVYNIMTDDKPILMPGYMLNSIRLLRDTVLTIYPALQM